MSTAPNIPASIIYLITNPSTKEKTILVSKLSELPRDSTYQLVGRPTGCEYHINGILFAKIITLPNYSTHVLDDMKNVIHYEFPKDVLIKQFETTDFFQSYLIYSIATV